MNKPSPNRSCRLNGLRCSKKSSYQVSFNVPATKHSFNLHSVCFVAATNLPCFTSDFIPSTICPYGSKHRFSSRMQSSRFKRTSWKPLLSSFKPKNRYGSCSSYNSPSDSGESLSSGIDFKLTFSPSARSSLSPS